jgi:hypothetical protein
LMACTARMGNFPQNAPPDTIFTSGVTVFSR